MRSTQTSWLRFLFAIIALCVPAVEAEAQVRSHGYALLGFGDGSFAGRPVTQLGIGINKVWTRGFSIGTEGGYATFGSRNHTGFWSFNVAQHFRPTSKVVPFATGGVSLISDAGGFNIGGGIHRRINDRLGFRAEFRQYLMNSSCCNETLGLSTGRVALSFR